MRYPGRRSGTRIPESSVLHSEEEHHIICIKSNLSCSSCSVLTRAFSAFRRAISSGLVMPSSFSFASRAASGNHLGVNEFAQEGSAGVE